MNPNNLTIIYCRISSDTQNFEAQEFACKEYCNRNGLFVNAIVREIGSARYGINNLPKLQELIFETGMPFNLVVWSVDRITRNINDRMVLYNLFIQNNINIITVNEFTFEIGTTQGRLTWNTRVEEAEHESNLISERVKRSVMYRRSIGDHIGNAGYGYKIVYVPITRHDNFNNLTETYHQGCSDHSGRLIAEQINLNRNSSNVINRTFRPKINEETQYNRRVLMYDIKEMDVIDFIKCTFEKRMSTLEFMNYAKTLIDYLDLDWTPIKFYKEFDDTDEGEYSPRNEFKTYYFCYIGSTEFYDLPKKSFIAYSKVIQIQDYHITGFLNDYHITKRGEIWTREMVKYIASKQM